MNFEYGDWYRLTSDYNKNQIGRVTRSSSSNHSLSGIREPLDTLVCAILGQ